MITEFKSDQQNELADFVLAIQNGEFGLGFSIEEQPDLISTAQFYQSGGFWTALLNDKIIGCIGLQKLNNETGILRKMFVSKEHRGTELNIAQKLFNTLIDEAKSIGLQRILLDTPEVAKASHRFYQRNGFHILNRNDVPNGYSFPDRNSIVFELVLEH